MRPSRRQMLPFARRWTESRLPATTALLAAHAAAYVAQIFLEMLGPDRGWGTQWLQELMALSGSGIAEGHYWQFGSFLLVHYGPIHALLNALLLYIVGSELEPIIGPRHISAIFFSGSLLGGVIHWLVMPDVPLMGISAGVLAVLIAFTTTLPALDFTANLFWVLPVRLRAKYLAIGAMAICAALSYAKTALEIGPVAILLACVFGWLYARRLGFGNPLFFQRYLFERRSRAARIERMTPEQFISLEIDPILEKISRSGIQSLTRGERRLLQMGSAKVAAKPVGEARK